MYTIFDSVSETQFGPYNDYESAQMYLLHVSEGLADGGANLTIEYLSTPEEWAMDNGVMLAAL